MNANHIHSARVDQAFLHPQGKFTVYRVVIEHPIGLGADEKTIFKRFSDFIKLHTALKKVHKALGFESNLPPLSNVTYFDRFQPSVVESRRAALHTLVQFICSNEHLLCHTYFTRFIAGGVSKKFFNESEDVTANTPKLAAPQLTVSNNYENPTVNISTKCLSIKTDYLNHLSSPISSDSDGETESGALAMLWKQSTPLEDKIMECIRKAKSLSRGCRWSSAFHAYKSGVTLILQSLESDLSDHVRDEYRQLLSDCLSKAESIHREHLLQPPSVRTTVEDGIRPVWMKPPTLQSVCQDHALLPFFGSANELFNLKVCRLKRDRMVVSNRQSSVKEYWLLPLAKSSAPHQPRIRSTSAVSSESDYVFPLPTNSSPFMAHLHRLIETDSHLFVLTECPRGNLLLVNWIQKYLEKRIATALFIRNSRESAVKRGLGDIWPHLDWCRRRSPRFRRLFERLSSSSGDLDDTDSSTADGRSVSSDQFITSSTPYLLEDASTPYEISSQIPLRSPLQRAFNAHTPPIAPSTILTKYPPRTVLTARDDLTLTHREDFPLGFEEASKTTTASYLPECRIIQWASELVSAVLWLHEHRITPRNLNRSCVFLTGYGHIELSYFCRSPMQAAIEVLDHEDFSLAPELLVGAIARSFLCSKESAGTWWSVGVILYEVFTGIQLHESHPRGISRISSLELPPSLSQNARHLLNSLLQIDPAKRPPDSSLRTHPLFKSINWSEMQAPVQFPKSRLYAHL